MDVTCSKCDGSFGNSKNTTLCAADRLSPVPPASIPTSAILI